MYRLPKAIHIVGWGDVPSYRKYAVGNDAMLGRIQQRLTPLANGIKPSRSAAIMLEELKGSIPKSGPRARVIKETIALYSMLAAGVAPNQDAIAELVKIKSLTGQEMTDKIGVVERQLWPKKTTSKELALIATDRAIEVASRNDPNFSSSKVKMFVSGGSSPDDLYPCCAGALQKEFGTKGVEGFDVSLACSSGTQAVIELVRAMTFNGYDYGVVGVGERIASGCNDLLSENAMLWGDGGGSVVLSAVPWDSNRNFGFIATKSSIDGSLAYTTRSCGIGAHPDHRILPINASMEGHGRKIYKWVIGPVANDLKDWLLVQDINVDSRTFLLPHNGNLKMVASVGETIGIPFERILHRITDRGNQSSASVLSTLAYYAEQGFFKRGDQLILVTFGGGVAYNFIVYRWP